MTLARVLLLALLGAGCGTNRPEIPPELLIDPGDVNDGRYPDGPYGVEPGEIAANVCFQGFRAPRASGHGAGDLEPICLGDFYDPSGARSEILLVNSAAIWCSVCQVEHRAMPDEYARQGPFGLAILSALFEDERRAPADLHDLTTWVEAFDVPFPMVMDPDFQLGAYAPAELAPLNLVVDARSMRILEKFAGEDSTLWPLIEDELRRRAAEN